MGAFWFLSLKGRRVRAWRSLRRIVFVYNYFRLRYIFNYCCYNVFSIDFPIPSFWMVSYIIWLPLDDPGPPSIDHPGHYLSAYPIRHLPKPLVSWGSQDNTVQGFSPHKCIQEVWWDALNVVVATIHSVMSGLNPFPKLFLYSMTSFGNVPLTWPYYSSV